MRISDWSSDVCSSDLGLGEVAGLAAELVRLRAADGDGDRRRRWRREADRTVAYRRLGIEPNVVVDRGEKQRRELVDAADRSEEHTSELQSLMRISYAVFCLKKNKQLQNTTPHPQPKPP